jgi:hypothetical protein
LPILSDPSENEGSHERNRRNPRELEEAQVIRLMNIIADQIYVGQYQDELGTRRIENKVQNGEDAPEPHLSI